MLSLSYIARLPYNICFALQNGVSWLSLMHQQAYIGPALRKVRVRRALKMGRIEARNHSFSLCENAASPTRSTFYHLSLYNRPDEGVTICLPIWFHLSAKGMVCCQVMKSNLKSRLFGLSC